MPAKKGVYKDATGHVKALEISGPVDNTDIKAEKERLRMESRRTHIAELIAEGVINQTRIAKTLGARWGIKVSRRTVQKDMVQIREEWRKIRVQDADVYLGRELSKIDRVEQEAWKAWHDSRKRHETDKQKDVKHSMQGDGVETEKITKDSTGDPRYLDIVQSCIDKRCKLLGLQIPEGSNSVNVMIQNHKTTVVNMSNADLKNRLEQVLGVN